MPSPQKAIHKVLSSSGDFNFFAGSIPFIIGSLLADAEPRIFFLPTALCFVVGSALFLAGSVCKLMDSCWSAAALRQYSIYEVLYIHAGLWWTAGGMLFTIGACFFLSKENKSATIVWVVGGASFMAGTTFQLFADQVPS